MSGKFPNKLLGYFEPIFIISFTAHRESFNYQSSPLKENEIFAESLNI